MSHRAADNTADADNEKPRLWLVGVSCDDQQGDDGTSSCLLKQRGLDAVPGSAETPRSGVPAYLPRALKIRDSRDGLTGAGAAYGPCTPGL